MKWQTWLILGVVSGLIITGAIILYGGKMQQQYLINNAESMDEIINHVSIDGGFVQLQVSPTTTQYLDEYYIARQDGIESSFDVNFTKIDKEQWQIDVTLNKDKLKAYVEYLTQQAIDEGQSTNLTRAMEIISYLSYLPTTINITKDEILQYKSYLDVDIIRISKNESTARFSVIVNNKKDRWLKIGDNSIVIKQKTIFYPNDFHVNTTAEPNNHTHLNITTTFPYNNLIGYWSFDGDGINKTAYDWSNNHLDGTYLRNSTLNATGIYGSAYTGYGSATAANGIFSSGIDLSNYLNRTLAGSRNLTISMWVYNHQVSPTIAATLIGSGGCTQSGGNYDQICLLLTSSGVLRFYISNYSAIDFIGSITLPANKWIYLAATYNGSEMIMYINGTAQAEKNSSVNEISRGGTNFAAAYAVSGIGYTPSNSGHESFNGSIDEVMVFNATLSSAQILAIFNNQSERFSKTGIQTPLPQFHSYVNLTDGTQVVSSGTLADDGAFTFNANAIVSADCLKNLSGIGGNFCTGTGGTATADEFFIWNVTLPTIADANIVNITLNVIGANDDGADRLNISLYNYSAGAWKGMAQAGGVAADANYTVQYIIQGNTSSKTINNFVQGNKIQFMAAWRGASGDTPIRADFMEVDVGYYPNSWDNRLNISFDDIRLGKENQTNISVMVMYQNATGWQVTPQQNITNNNFNYTFSLNGGATDTKINYTFQSDSYGFFTPILNGNISISSWNITEGPTLDISPPQWNQVGANESSAVILQYVNFYSQWTDNVLLDKYIFSWNASGLGCDTWANDSDAAFLSNNWTNTTKQIPVACLGKIEGIGFQFFANDSSNNWNATSIQTPFIGVANTCSYTSGNWLVSCDDNCTISTNVDLAGNNLTINGTGLFILKANISNIDRRNIFSRNSQMCEVLRKDGGSFQLR